MTRMEVLSCAKIIPNWQKTINLIYIQKQDSVSFFDFIVKKPSFARISIPIYQKRFQNENSFPCRKFKNQIEQLNHEKDENAKKLNERMKILVSGHDSVLEQKNIEQQAMKSKLKQHQTVIESLNKEKKIASINQQKTNHRYRFTVTMASFS